METPVRGRIVSGRTAMLRLAALLGVDSVNSSGWRNRADGSSGITVDTSLTPQAILPASMPHPKTSTRSG